MTKTGLLAIALIIQFLSTSAQDRQTELLTLMKQANIPGLSLAYIKNGLLQEHYALGLQSNEDDRVVNDSTIFSGASLSKSIFSYVVFGLVNEKKLELDKPLYTYFIYKDVAGDPRSKLVTARMILSHSSGLPNWRNSDSLQFKLNPGEKYNYSGEGMVWLSKVVESITGKDIETYIKEKIFIPLGMSHSSYVWQKSFAGNLAYPHSDNGQSAEKYYPSNANVAHSLQTTAVDFSKFLVQMMKDKKFVTAFLKQPAVAIQDKISWGMGLGHQITSDGVAFFQWGDNGNSKGLVIGYPAKKEALVYFANADYGLSIANELAKMFFGKEQPLVAWLDYDKVGSPSITAFQSALYGSVSDAVKPFYIPGKTIVDTSKLTMSNLRYMANRFIELHDFDKATAVLQEALKIKDDDEEGYARMGELCLRSANREGAVKYFSLAAKSNNRDGFYQTLINKINRVAPVATGNQKLITFNLPEYMNAKHVSLAGSFNGWNDMKEPMYWKDGTWTTTVPLAPGNYEYKFVVDGVWLPDTRNSSLDIKSFNSKLVVN